MITFHVQPHTGRKEPMVEVFDDGRFVGVIYARTGELKIVSKHLDDYRFDATEPPVLTAVLKY
jgi:hypothetical protein